MECVLKDLIAVSKDGEWGKGEPFDDSVEMLAIRGTDFEDVRFGSVAGIPRRHIAKRHAERKLLQPWDVIIEAAGGTKNQITGRTVLLRPQLFSSSDLPFTCASFSRFIRFNTELCNPEFMFWYLQHLYASGFMHAYHTQHTGVARFQWTTFSEREPLEIPPLPTQRRIASILSAYDDLIENNQRRIRILEDMARSLYREWFVHFRYPGHESVPLFDSPLGQIPQGWEVKKLGGIADIKWGDTSKTKSSYVIEGYDAYSASGLDGKMDHFDFDRTGIVLSAIGAQCGRTWLAHGKWSCIKNTIRFWSKDNCVSTEFLFVATEGQEFWPRRGAAQPFISQGDAERKELLIPDRVTMNRFTTFAANALEQISTLQTKIQNLRRTRDLLLPRLLSGQISVRDDK